MPTATTKSVNRGWLLRQARAGRLWLKCRFHFTDDYAFDNAIGFGKMSDFRQAYLYVNSSFPELEAAHDAACRADHRSAETWRLMEELSALRRDHHSRQLELAGNRIVVRESDFRYKSGFVDGDRKSGSWSIHSNLNYDYEIR